MKVFISYVLVIIAMLIYNRIAWALYFTLGRKYSKRTADVVDAIHSVLFLTWLVWNQFYLFAGIGLFMWIQTNLNPEFQKHLKNMLENKSK